MIKTPGQSREYVNISDDCKWVQFGDIKYETIFNKKRRLTLRVMSTHNDRTKVMNDTIHGIQTEITRRLDDIAQLVQDIGNQITKLAVYEDIPTCHIECMVAVIQKHKEELARIHNRGRTINISYTKHSRYKEWILTPGRRHSINEHEVVWFRPFGDISQAMTTRTDIDHIEDTVIISPINLCWTRLESEMRKWS